jgi:hypothetical protein
MCDTNTSCYMSQLRQVGNSIYHDMVRFVDAHVTNGVAEPSWGFDETLTRSCSILQEIPSAADDDRQSRGKFPLYFLNRDFHGSP